MNAADRKPARITLGLTAGIVSAALGFFISASGVGAMLPTGAQVPGVEPTPYTSCAAPIPNPIPTPGPVCVTVTPTPDESPSASPSPSQAPKKKKPSKKQTDKVTIAYREKAGRFVGQVDSTGKCEELRRVVVFKVVDGKGERVGKAITDAAARYSVDLAKAKGKYYSKAPASVSVGYATQVDCKALKSRTITVPTAI